MEKILRNLICVLMISIFGFAFVFAQKPDEELTKEEAVQRIQEFQNIVTDLQNKLQALDNEIEKLKNDLTTTNSKLKNCLDSYLGLLGINPETNKPFTQEDVEKFRQRIGQIENKIREMRRFSDDELADRRSEVEALENSLNELRLIKFAILPEFYNKIISLASDIRGLYKEKKIKKYVVGTWAENRDCLWNIAGKIEIFGDPFLWPKIWMANTDMIKNPDIIHPGQALLIPPSGPKTPDEIKAERKYWRQKKAAQETETKETKEEGKKSE